MKQSQNGRRLREYGYSMKAGNISMPIEKAKIFIGGNHFHQCLVYPLIVRLSLSRSSAYQLPGFADS